ncbi:MFS transporter [Candidatus Parcubacteria bacterium]|jgi:MFS family permease|nr:MFS transporter [Candidatus Parcubacteria bacterium]
MLKVNKIVKYLILSDIAFWTGWGLITPIFAIFIVDEIQGATALTVGIASAIYCILTSLLRVPIGMFLDNCKGEQDDYLFLTVGLFIAALVPFGFIFCELPWHIYLFQAIYATGMAMSLSGWTAIFTRHIDKGKEATEWGLDATFLGFGAGISGVVGGWAATNFGFVPVFVAVGIFGILGVILLLFLRNDIKGIFGHGMRFSLKEISRKDQEQK